MESLIVEDILVAAPLSTLFFSTFLILFVISIAILVWVLPNKRHAKFLYIIFHLLSLLFVLTFILYGWRQSGPQFIEIGNYYPLNAVPNNSQLVVNVGSADENPDFIIDEDCQPETCFSGIVSFRFESKANAANRLTWQTSDNFKGTLYVIKPRDYFGGTLIDSVAEYLPRWLKIRREYTDGVAGIDLQGEVSRVVAVWESPIKQSSVKPLRLPITIELNPQETLPRLVIERPRPRIIELPNQRNTSDKNSSQPSNTLAVFLTSFNNAMVLKQSEASGTTASNNFIPTINVGAVDPKAQITAYLEFPDSSKTGVSPSEFIINTGLYRKSDPLGKRTYLGGERGIVATVVSGAGLSLWKYIGVVVVLWLIPLLFFTPIIRYTDLWALVSIVQMLLGVRFVLSLRAYLWAPFSQQAIESAVLALLLVPLLLFSGCFLLGLRHIGADRERQHSIWKLIKNYPPVIYYVTAVLTLLVIFQVLQIPSSQFVAGVHAFDSWGESLQTWLLLLLLPPFIWLAGLLIDWKLRKGKARDVRYTVTTGVDDDPFMYSLMKPYESLKRTQTWSLRCTLELIPVLLLGAAAFTIWIASRSLSSETTKELLGLLTGLIALAWAVSLKRLSNLTKGVNQIIALTGQVLCWEVFGIALLSLFKSIWNLSFYRAGFSKAVPEALFPYLPVRTNLIFEILILCLTFRLLTAFFESWRDAYAPFDWQEFLNLAVIFFAPALMFIISLIASHDTGAVVVHGPALVGATLLLTGLWPLWKAATGRREALWAITISLSVILLYYLLAFTSATKLIIPLQPHSTFTHRILLLEGTNAAARSAETGGPQLLEAIEQNWRMMNYAAEGGWKGRGYGNAPVPNNRTFGGITLDDLVFSVYVLSEHGAFGGLALLSLYILLFMVVLRLAWDKLRDDPVRLALACGLSLMLIFPAIYMAAANVNQGIFTGQNIPLLGLRSNSDILRSGIVLMLLAAALRLGDSEWSSEQQKRHLPRWAHLVGQSLAMIRFNRMRKAERLKEISYNPLTSAAAVAGNMALVLLLVLLVACLPIVGITMVSDNEEYKKALDLTELKDRAAKYIRDNHIWFEPITQGELPGRNCLGGNAKNSAAPANIPPAKAYQLCIDDDVEGAAKDDTLATLIKQWNKRPLGRGNTTERSYDGQQFFQLNISQISAGQPDRRSTQPLRVNPSIYRWASPFHPLSDWTGTLTDVNAARTNGGALIGAGLVLPLMAVPAHELPVFVGTGHTQVDLGKHETYRRERGFSIYDPELNASIFKIETISGATGALLRPQEGDFDIFINGCPLAVRAGSNCTLLAESNGETGVKGTVPPIRIDYGDVIAYAPRDASGRRYARHVFIYSDAELGAFSYLAWANGSVRRYYPQGSAWPMAQQVSKSLAATVDGNDASGKDVVITVDAALNREVYSLLRDWRAALDKRIPIKEGKRRMAVTLMDTNTGELLVLASDDGNVYDPNMSDVQPANQPNLNLIRHRIGSAIKPFTAAATLSAFPRLYEMTLLDQRSDKRKVFGLPLGSERGITGRGGASTITWQNFIERSDNLYAVTLSLLGMCDTRDTHGLPKFEKDIVSSGQFTLELNDRGSSYGMPRWSSPNMFDLDKGRVALIEQTPLSRQLDELFDVRTREPQMSSYDPGLWNPLKGHGWRLTDSSFNHVSPEIPNFAFIDINNFRDLRSVLLGGELAGPEQYGNIGSAWSNVYLAQSFARITSGRKITAQIVAGVTPTREEWFPGVATSAWRQALLRSLEGVAMDTSGTAYSSLNSTVRSISGQRPTFAVGSHATYFTVFSKTGTLDPDAFEAGNSGPRLADSIFIFTAGLWNDSDGTFSRSVTGAIYLEQASEQAREQSASALAAKILQILDGRPQFNWSGKQR